MLTTAEERTEAAWAPLQAEQLELEARPARWWPRTVSALEPAVIYSLEVVASTALALAGAQEVAASTGLAASAPAAASMALALAAAQEVAASTGLASAPAVAASLRQTLYLRHVATCLVWFARHINALRQAPAQPSSVPTPRRIATRSLARSLPSAWDQPTVPGNRFIIYILQACRHVATTPAARIDGVDEF